MVALIVLLGVIAIAAVILLDPASNKPIEIDAGNPVQAQGPVQPDIAIDDSDRDPAVRSPDPTRIEVDSNDQPVSPTVLGAEVRGRVVNGANAPVPGASVLLTERASMAGPFSSPDFKDLDRRTALTDADGYYSFRRLPAGTEYGMWVYHAKYAPVEGVPLRAIRGESQELQTIVLSEGYWVEGSVTDEVGAALAGAEVVIQLQSAFMHGGLDEGPFLSHQEKVGRLRRVKSGADGRYRFEHLAQGIYQLEATLEGYASAVANAVQCVGEEWERQHDLVLGAEFRLAGIVRDEEGNPVAGAVVAGARTRPRPIYQARATSADDGTFELRGLPEGTYGISVLADGYAMARMSHIRTGRDDLVFVMRQKGRVSGTVTDPRGQPVSSFSLELYRVNKGTAQFGMTGKQMSVADPGGVYLFPEIDRGSYVLLVTAPGYAPTYTPGFFVDREEVTDINAELELGGTVIGKVSDENGRALNGAVITLRGQDFNPWNQHTLFGAVVGDPNNVPASSTRSGADGRFVLKDAFPGDHQLEVSSPGLLSTYVGIYVQTGGQSNAGEVRLERGSTISGLVRSRAGDAAAGAAVFLSLKSTNNGFLNKKSISDALGRYSFGALMPGIYEVSAMREDSSAFFFPGSTPGSSKDVVVREGSDISADLIVPNI